MKKFSIDSIKPFGTNNKGFTLIEILIVIGILSILAAIVIPIFRNLYGKGEAEAAEMEQRIAQPALISYMTQNGERSVVPQR